MKTRAEQNKKLLEAAKSGDTAAIKAALAAGAEIDARDNDENTPLMIAAENGRESALRFLLDQGSDTSLKNVYNSTALFKAARYEQPFCLTVLVDHLIKKYNRSPEELAAHLKTDNARLILGSFGKKHCIAAPMMKLIEFLREHNLDEDKIRELMPVDFVMPAKPAADAATIIKPEPVKASDKTVEAKPAAKKYNPAETEQLIDAASKNDLAGVIAALDAGAEIDASTAKHGGNALHVASKRGFTNVMAELLKRGADVNVRSNLDTKNKVNGATPLIWAAQKTENTAAVELLLTAKAEINAARNDGVTALHYAAYDNNHEVCELLVKHGANAAVIDRSKYTPLLYAVQQGNNFPIKFLVENLLTTHTGKHIELLTFLRQNDEFKQLIKLASSRAASLELMRLIDFLLANNISHAEINALFPEKYTFKNTKFKEDLLIHLQSLPATKRLAMCNSILTKPNHPYRVILSMQRGSRPCKLGHGILKQVADLEAKTQLSIEKANKPDINNDNATPLYTAAMDGDMAKVKQLIHDGADCSSTVQTGGILFGAAQCGDIDIINLLVENGADPGIEKRSDKLIFSSVFQNQNQAVKARLKTFCSRFAGHVITVTPADIAEIFGHTEAADLLRILAGEDPVVATQQAPTEDTSAAPVAEVVPAAAPPAPVPTLYPTVAPAIQQESSALDAYMSARKEKSTTQQPAAAQKVELAEAAAATLAAPIKLVAPLQPTVVSTLSIFTPGKAIALVFDTPNPEINVPVLQPQKIAPSAVTSSSASRHLLFSLDAPVANQEPALPAWVQELNTPTPPPVSEDESAFLKQLEALDPAPTHQYTTEHQPIKMVNN